MESESKVYIEKRGVSFSGLLTIVFITLKLCGVINWSWIYVLAPLWFVPAVVVGLGFLAIPICLIVLIGKKTVEYFNYKITKKKYEKIRENQKNDKMCNFKKEDTGISFNKYEDVNNTYINSTHSGLGEYDDDYINSTHSGLGEYVDYDNTDLIDSDLYEDAYKNILEKLEKKIFIASQNENWEEVDRLCNYKDALNKATEDYYEGNSKVNTIKKCPRR